MILKTDASRKRDGMRRFNKTLLNYDACLGNYLEKDVRKKSLRSFSWLFWLRALLEGVVVPFTPTSLLRKRLERKLHGCAFFGFPIYPIKRICCKPS